ncbi:MAG: hypothetical protein OXU31_07340 [Gammaproteobacteria bacterium]|nr:hypothetical protein [Gammaproteobacteria bacterium]
MPKSPKLIFPQGTPQGFPSSYIDGVKGSDFAPIRELLQNGLDAAVDKGEPKAIIRFAVKKLRLSDIPGIGDYRKHFEKAVRDQSKLDGGLSDVAKNIVEPIRECLKKTCIDVLCVSDNGIGLNEKSMTALLSTAMGNKASKFAGAFGLGHLSAFSSSNLNYVLYGGTSQSGRICAGHASLASCNKAGKDGYYVSKYRNDNLKKPYDFYSGNKIPAVIAEELNSIEEMWNSGSIVIIPGFNWFLGNRDSENLKDVIFKIAALNFFVAIHKEELTIEFTDGTTTHKLSKNALASILEQYKDESRAKTSGFITGIRAYEAYQNLTLGNRISVETDMGQVNIMYRDEIGGGRPTRVELCRNGMHITNRIPNFQNKFGDLKPFHCLITSGGGDDFSRAVKRSEDHTHSKLQATLISDSNERKRFNASLKAIVDWLRGNTSHIDADFHNIDDAFVVKSSGIGKGGDIVGLKGAVTKTNPSAPPLPKEPPGATGPKEGIKRRKKSTFNRSGSLLPLRALVVRAPSNRLSVSIEPNPHNQNGEIRFVVDKHIDSGDFSYVKINDVLVNGNSVPRDALTKAKNGDALGILLGKIPEFQNSDSLFSMEIVYDLPEKYTSFDNEGDSLVFRAEMVSRKITP